ncbi:MAG: universal stress protein [Planctomycetota bacterium]
MKILFAFDDSEPARAARAILARLPLSKGSEITVLTVAEDSGHVLSQLHGEDEAVLEAARAEGERAALALARSAAEELRRTAVDVHLVARTGHVTREILSQVRDLGVDLLVTGARGLSTFDRLVLGSVAAELLSDAPCSLLLARTGPAGEPEPGQPLEIVFATDGSKPAGVAADQLAALPLGDRARVHVVTVLELISGFGAEVQQRLSAAWHREKDFARAHVEDVKARLEATGAIVDTEVLESEDVADSIARIAEMKGADLLVIGHRGRGLLSRMSPGRIARQVAQLAPCSVWIAK